MAEAGDRCVHVLSPGWPVNGVAWSPDKFGCKTVIRAGVGMFVAPILISTLAQNGNYSSSPITNQEGFSQETAMTPSTKSFRMRSSFLCGGGGPTPGRELTLCRLG